MYHEYEDNIGESFYPENQYVGGESEINKIATAEPEIAELEESELELPKDLVEPMQPGPSEESSAVEENWYFLF